MRGTRRRNLATGKIEMDEKFYIPLLC